GRAHPAKRAACRLGTARFRPVACQRGDVGLSETLSGSFRRAAPGRPHDQPRRGRHRPCGAHRPSRRFHAGGAPCRRDAADRSGVVYLLEGARRTEDARGDRLSRHHPVWHRRGSRGLALPRGRQGNSDHLRAAEGGGLTRVMAYQAAEALKAGKLRIVLKEFELPAVPIHIVYPTSRLLSAKVRTFIDLVTEIADWHFG